MPETPPPKSTRRGFGLSLLDGSPLPEDRPTEERDSDLPPDHEMTVEQALKWKSELEELRNQMISALLDNIQLKDALFMAGAEINE